MSPLKTAFIGPWIFFSLLISCLGQTPISGSGHPKSEWELSDAPIKPLVEGRILASLIDAHKDEYQQDEQDEIKPVALRSTVKFVRLDGRGRIVHGDGWDYRFRRTTHHGVFDFYVRQNMSAGSGTRYEYQFDGKVYQQVDSIGEQF